MAGQRGKPTSDNLVANGWDAPLSVEKGQPGNDLMGFFSHGLYEFGGQELNTQISKKTTGYRVNVEFYITQHTAHDASLAERAYREDMPTSRECALDLHRAVLVALSDDRRSSVAKVGEEPHGVAS